VLARPGKVGYDLSMIASIHGTLEHIGGDHLIVQVGGVGLKVYVPGTAFGQVDGVGRPVRLHTHLVVREDSLALYGFVGEGERTLFETLLSVPGIGPRLALAVLSTLSPELLVTAVQRDEPDVLVRVPGIGRKTAEKVLLELKGRLPPEMMLPSLAPISHVDTEVIEALTSLGYSIVEAQAALQSIPHDAPEDVEERVRLALAYFAS
jgi:Holliday junction DNA helicase RuvA